MTIRNGCKSQLPGSVFEKIWDEEMPDSRRKGQTGFRTVSLQTGMGAAEQGGMKLDTHPVSPRSLEGANPWNGNLGGGACCRVDLCQSAVEWGLVCLFSEVLQGHTSLSVAGGAGQESRQDMNICY